MMNVNGNSLESHSQCSHYGHHFCCNLDYNYKSDPLPTGYKLESSILLQCAHYMKHKLCTAVVAWYYLFHYTPF